MKQQSADVGKTQRWTLHIHDSAIQTPQTPSPFTFPQLIQCSTRSGTLPPLEFSGRGAQRPWMPETDFYPEWLSPLSRLALPESPQALAAAVACTVKGRSGSDTWKHCDCFLTITLTPRINFSFLCLEALQVFCLFGVCRNNRGFTLILCRRIKRPSSWFAFSNTKLQTCFESFQTSEEEVVAKAAHTVTINFYRKSFCTWGSVNEMLKQRHDKMFLDCKAQAILEGERRTLSLSSSWLAVSVSLRIFPLLSTL